ncbi:unnamed protein product [Ranitomeya imitator]|uniref:Kinesin motor domain-containing protein n=1 Tax=Ranitomeya imitator TaxID=111125 RepID=A0ABN9LVY0_9NEOB|nr:unnamed protein product [Ranitomeya imitator]
MLRLSRTEENSRLTRTHISLWVRAEVCAGTVAEVIQSVVNGADGCVFCFGHSKLGKSYTMIGKDDSMQNLGIIPCAISWLFKLINERKEKTGARFSVRVSAVEVWGKEENLRDLLSEVATGSLQDGQSPGVYLCEDPICGMQILDKSTANPQTESSCDICGFRLTPFTKLQNQSELRAPTAEKAAFFLDAAIASRKCSQRDCDEDDHRNSHMLFTLHIYQYRMEKKWERRHSIFCASALCMLPGCVAPELSGSYRNQFCSAELLLQQ